MAEPSITRILSQLRLALISDCGCANALAKAETDARHAGLSGADIDAALVERSFDVRTSAVLAYGCALKSGDPAACVKAEREALACGLNRNELDHFAAFSLQLLNENNVELHRTRLEKDHAKN